MNLSFLKYFGFTKKQKCIEMKPPNHPNLNELVGFNKIFLGGSIEMGKAIDWQKELVGKLNHLEILFFNPRRDDWDATWEQTIENEQFNEQVTWELDKLEESDIIIMYFAPNTLSPITLLEFGMHCRSNKLVVYCPEGFWRKGNVDIVCERFNIKTVGTVSELTDYIISIAKK